MNTITKSTIPSISIITITYNAETSLEATIKSVISQSYENIEYIIIDGGSTDRTVELIEKYQDHIKYWISEPDKGISDAWNKGIAASSGDIIGILNAGDYFEIDCVAKVVLSLGVDEFAISYGTTILLDEDLRSTKTIRGHFNPNNLSLGLGFYHPGTFASRLVYERVGYFNCTYRFAMDCDWFLRCQKQGVAFKKIDNICYMPTDGISHKSKFSAYGEYLQTLVNNGYSPYLVYWSMIVVAIRAIIGKLLLTNRPNV
jgi:glycosyltransferase involved in cell wall biosynthesis